MRGSRSKVRLLIRISRVAAPRNRAESNYNLHQSDVPPIPAAPLTIFEGQDVVGTVSKVADGVVHVDIGAKFPVVLKRGSVPASACEPPLALRSFMWLAVGE